MKNFEYNIGDKLYEFAIMSHEDFDKLRNMYTELIELVCCAKETDSKDENLDCLFKMFQTVRACLNFSPYTHFYTQVLIDIIVKTYIQEYLEVTFYSKIILGYILRMHGLHYYHQKKFKECSKKARELRDNFSDNQLEYFKIEFNKLSGLYWK